MYSTRDYLLKTSVLLTFSQVLTQSVTIRNSIKLIKMMVDSLTSIYFQY